MATGSIYWQVAVGDDEAVLVTRREIADGCRRLALPNDRILPVEIQERLEAVPREGYGVKRVAVTLEDGTEYSGVRVAWGTEVVAVQRYGPFRLMCHARILGSCRFRSARPRWAAYGLT